MENLVVGLCSESYLQTQQIIIKFINFILYCNDVITNIFVFLLR